MRKINEQQIIAWAPNANAVKNARKISAQGGFVFRLRSEDDTFYMGECKGSGKSNYVVSADFIEEGQPVFRCSCPSRQFPCKHSVALLFEMMEEKPFDVGEIPADILDKRAKKEVREARKAAKEAGDFSVGNDGGGASGKGISKSTAASRRKKIEKQLEGLKLLKQLVDDLLFAGLGSMGGVSLKNYRNLAKQLGDYYLPGPLLQLNRLILEIEAYQQDSDSGHYHAAVEILIRLRAIEKKASVYLQEKLASGSMEEEDNILYEELGGIWKLDQLNALGLKKEDARIVQLSFQVLYEEAGKEFIDRGYWVDVDTGEVFTTENYRPLKALKYIKQEDSCFDLLHIPVLTRYPGEGNPRIRWESAEFEPVTDLIRRSIQEKAKADFAAVVKSVKNQIKNTLSNDYVGVVLAFERIGRISGDGDSGKPVYAMEDVFGNRLEIRDREGWEPTAALLSMLPDQEAFRQQALFGLVYYDSCDRKICIHPHSLITDEKIIRLLY